MQTKYVNKMWHLVMLNILCLICKNILSLRLIFNFFPSDTYFYNKPNVDLRSFDIAYNSAQKSLLIYQNKMSLLGWEF